MLQTAQLLVKLYVKHFQTTVSIVNYLLTLHTKVQYLSILHRLGQEVD